MFHNGYDEEISRRSYGREGRGMLKTAGDLALALSVVVFGTLFWFYVAIPVWGFGNEIVSMTEENQRGVEGLRPMVGRCFDNGMGAVGLAISVADGSHLKVAFASGFSQTYPAAALKAADCPSK
jgi:hypothetical protein